MTGIELAAYLLIGYFIATATDSEPEITSVSICAASDTECVEKQNERHREAKEK